MFELVYWSTIFTSGPRKPEQKFSAAYPCGSPCVGLRVYPVSSGACALNIWVGLCAALRLYGNQPLVWTMYALAVISIYFPKRIDFKLLISVINQYSWNEALNKPRLEIIFIQHEAKVVQ